MNTTWRWTITALLALLLTACAVIPEGMESLPRDSALRRCADFFTALDRQVAAAGVADAQAARVPGFPYLRTDRFLASYAAQPLAEAQFAEWLDRLRALDLAARRAELGNLPAPARATLETRLPEGQTTLEAVERCGQQWAENDRAQSARRAALLARAAVPDEYRTVWRVLGLYPLTSLVVTSRIKRYHEKTLTVFAAPLEDLPVRGQMMRYIPNDRARATPVSPESLTQRVREAPRSALGIPELDRETLAQLFSTHAPEWEVDTVSEADRIGQPVWDNEHPSVDIISPMVYRHASYTRYRGEVLLQLNYTMWFPERPRTGAFDILGGRLDGITWRVTLDHAGRPLLYDAMHNCGCYYMAFPTPGLRLRPEALAEREPPLVPQSAPVLAPGEHMVIRLEAGTHYLQRIHASRGGLYALEYALQDYDALRSLPMPNGEQRSLFGTDGIVPGTDRRERWVLWPMGVPGPGAMRQHGHHAIAFVGRRHFDDANLLDRLFSPVPP